MKHLFKKQKLTGYKVFQALLFNVLILVLSTNYVVAAENLTMFNYRLGSGDEIQINVFGEEDLSLSTLLGDTGVINYPFLGEIKVSGLTINQVEVLITNGLKPDYLVNPSVQVSITEYRPFFVDGEINNPGGYPYQPGLNVSKALALAGGLTDRASKSAISVIRASDKNTQSIKVTLNDPIYPGDIISIDESFF